jgi:HK97 family phage prohead protease
MEINFDHSKRGTVPLPDGTRFLSLEAGKVTENGEVEGWANVKVMDRYNELVLPEAFKDTIDLFMRNPVFLFGHNYNLTGGEIPVIGSVTEISLKDEGIYFKAVFASTELAQRVRQLFLEGHLRMFSIGFIPHETRMPDNTELAKYGAQLRTVITRAELLEISAVPVPGNQLSGATAVKNMESALFDWGEMIDIAKELKDKEASVKGPDIEDVKHKVARCVDLLTKTVKEFNMLISAVNVSGETQKEKGGEPQGKTADAIEPETFKRLIEQIKSL